MDFENVDINKLNAWEMYHYALKLFDSGDTDNGIKYLTLAAEKGCSYAMTSLGDSYWEGDGVEQDEDEAIKWYKLAAAHGDSDAVEILMDEIGLDYSEEPLEWCKMVAEHGESEAQIYLAEMYDGKDFEESLKWYKLAAEGGNRYAIYHLGHIYYYGDGVEQSYKEAYYWFDKDGFRELPYYICADMYFYVDKNYENAFRLYHSALNDGVEMAAYKIGEMYYYGLGTKQDYNMAFEFLKYYEGEFDERDFDFAPPIVHRLLGEMYKNGWGVEQNLKEAEKLFKAADNYNQ